MPQDLPPLIRALLDPARYPHPVAQVDLVQTHTAWVLLAGAWAYKIKKPLRLSFLDFGTLAQRRAACAAEIRVNQRFATPDPATHIYLQVLPICGTSEAPLWGVPGRDDGCAIEYALQMRRFDETGRLDHLCARGELSPAHLSALAQRMAALQSAAAVAAPDGPWGQPDDGLAFARDNLETLRASLSAPEAVGRLRWLSDWSEARAVQLAPLLRQRLQAGRVREGHGDLHLANLVLINGQVLPFDAIEFNDALRWIDVASDIAFAWMDLLDHRQPGLANWLLCEWLDASGDASAAQVLPFFAVYRALVRAKVAALRSTQCGADAAAAQAQTSEYLALAQRIAQPAQPQLLITHGLSGSGKTWAATRWLLTDPAGRAIRLRSDVERKHLHRLSALQSSASGVDSGLYSPQQHRATYDHLLQRAQALLAEGWTVLVDAAFLRLHERAAFAALAQTLQCPFHIIAPVAPLALLRTRIAQRQASGNDASEATLAVLEQQLGWIEPLDASERALCLPCA
ncbi:MAG: hypothetical protein EST26_03045 [Hydrogenophaga sp.]|nr:hypothetical protein [Hydrogenophaga sp.]